MKQSVLGFNQEASIKLGLTLRDLLLLQYITCAITSDSMTHVCDEDGTDYVWLQRKKILEDLPVLAIKERELNYSLNRLKELGLLKTRDIRENGVRGSRIYYGVTEKCNDLLCNDKAQNQVNTRVTALGAKNCNQTEIPKDMTAKNCNHTEIMGAKNCNQTTQLGAKNCTSDNKLNNNNFTNVKLEQPSVTPSTVSNSKRRTLVTVPVKEKTVRKKNLFDNCMEEIEKFTTDEDIRSLLKIYLPIRLARKDIQVNLPSFRGMLNRLCRVAPTKDLMLASIQQSIDRQYPTFYEVHKPRYNDRKKFAEGKNGLKLGRDENEEIINEEF